MSDDNIVLCNCFCGYFFVVIDVEIGGFNYEIDVLLEIVVVILDMDENGNLILGQQIYYYVVFFEGVNIEQVVLDFIGIDFYYLF